MSARDLHAITCAALLGAACVSPSSDPGFLGDYSALQPSAVHPDARCWLSPDAFHYAELSVPPVVACFSEHVHGRPVDVGELDAVLTRLRGALIDAIDDRYLLASSAGADVLRLEVAVTRLHDLDGDSHGLRGADVEVRGVDSETGMLVFAAVYSHPFSDAPAALDAGWLTARAADVAERVTNDLKLAEK